MNEYDERLERNMCWGEYHGLEKRKESDKRSFCAKCGKMIKIGQQYYYESRNIPFRRMNRTIRWHYPKCEI